MLDKLRHARACACGATLLVALSLAQTPAQEAKRARRVRTPDAPTTQLVDEQQTAEAAGKTAAAARIFEQAMKARDNALPKELIERAEAVAVFPEVSKASFVVGGRGSSGVISRRVKGGWSAPAFFHLGGRVGAQSGVAKTDFVLLFMNESALQALLEDKFEMDGEARAPAGPLRRKAAATNFTLDAGILFYSRARGLFAGLELKGAVINPDNKLNEAIYGQKADKLLSNTDRVHINKLPVSVRIFPVTLARYSRK